MKKQWITILGLLATSISFAHDEGHGPKLTDAPKQGGVVAPVIKASDANLHAKAAVVYKGELVRSEDGSVRVYVYDQAMNPLNLANFDKNAKAVLEAKKKKKWEKHPFELKLEGDAFTGKAPQAPSKPFNIDVTLKDGSQSLLVAFDNLD